MQVNGNAAIRAVLTDITERKQAERELERLRNSKRRSRNGLPTECRDRRAKRIEEELSSHVTIWNYGFTERTEDLRRQADLLELAYNAILVRDLEGRITFWNARARRVVRLDQG